MTNRWTDGRTDEKIMLLLHTLTLRGSHVASSVKFHQVVYRIPSVIRQGLPFQNNLKDLVPSCKTNLNLWDCFGRKLHFIAQLHKQD